MCTLMEKDALVELVSDVQAYMARHNPSDDRKPEQTEISQIKGWLHSTNPDFIDFDGVVKHCHKLKNQFPLVERHTA